MAAHAGSKHVTGSVGTSADTLEVTSQINQLAITNYHATQNLFVRVASSAASSAAALAAVVTAVADADENIMIPAGKRVVVFKSKRRLWVSASMIASGATTNFHANGTEWFD